MSQNTKACTYCGAICDGNDVYCKKCSQSFPKESIKDDPVFEGIDNETVKKFIGKSSNYYLRKFAKATDKNFFLQLNCASLLFGKNWLFYRKMYKTGVLLSVISILLSAALLLCFSLVFSSDVEQYFAAKQAYDDYVNSDVEMFVWNEDGYLVENEEYDYSTQDNLEMSQNKIRWINFFISAPVFLLDIFFRLLGNSFYKRQVISNVNNSSKSGTSVVAAIVGAIAMFLVNVIVLLLVSSIPAASQFQEAVNSLYIWL